MSTASHAQPFGLHEVVADVCVTNPTVANPYDLAELVLAKINSHDYREALRQALHPYLTGFVTQHRPTNHQSSGAGSGSGARAGTGRAVGRSRLAGVGNLLSSREFSPYRGAWILLSDATVEDLRSIAVKRGEAAATYIEKQRWYAGVADLLVAHGVATVGALPVTVQASLAAGTLP